jgi:hypothetical protein
MMTVAAAHPVDPPVADLGVDPARGARRPAWSLRTGSPKPNAMNSTFTGLFSEIEDTTIAR